MGISLLIYVSQVGLELQFHVWVYGRHIEVENCFLASSMDILITWLCIGVSWGSHMGNSNNRIINHGK